MQGFLFSLKCIQKSVSSHTGECYFDFIFKRPLCQCMCRLFSICEWKSSCLPHCGTGKAQNWLLAHCFCLGHNLKLIAACVDNYFYICSIKSFEMLTTCITMNIFVGFVVVNRINSMHFVMCVSICLWKAILLEKESLFVSVTILRLIRNLTFECLVANKPRPYRFCTIKLSLFLGL